jgi:hypothetical protein
MTPVHPGGPSPGHSLGRSPSISPSGTSPGTSLCGSSAASTRHFGDLQPPTFTRGDLGFTPTPSPE